VVGAHPVHAAQRHLQRAPREAGHVEDATRAARRERERLSPGAGQVRRRTVFPSWSHTSVRAGRGPDLTALAAGLRTAPSQCVFV
jgi:hypothetical protein